MIKIYAGELDGRRSYAVESEKYKVKWWFGDDWKKEDSRSIVTVVDKKTKNIFVQIYINNENDIKLANNFLKCLDVEITTDLKNY